MISKKLKDLNSSQTNLLNYSKEIADLNTPISVRSLSIIFPVNLMIPEILKEEFMMPSMLW